MRIRRVGGAVAVSAAFLALAGTVIAVSGPGGRSAVETPAALPQPTPATAYQPSTSAPATPSRTARRPTTSAPAGTSRAATSAPHPSAPTASARPATAGIPLPVAGTVGNAQQLVTVAAPSASSTQAIVQAWSKTSAGWTRTGPGLSAWLGYGGMTDNAREGFNGTPIGSFALTRAFGNNADPGTALPYFQSRPDDWWSGDSASPTYNTHQRCTPASCHFRTDLSENLHDIGWVYGYAVVIDYNTAPVVAGKGSAFFLHVTQDKPTEGCVSVPQADLVRILRWLDPKAHPRILMGIARS
jgi:L,D-peptidoglycan transpeptidase YkuD (ErfK/YbiS/YcfS/YnhG family)